MDFKSKIRDTLVAGAAAASCVLLVAVATLAGASAPHSKFINSLHAWAPASKHHRNQSEVSLGETICHKIEAVASNQVPGVNGEDDAAVGQPRGTTAVEVGWSDLVNDSGQLLLSNANQGLPAQATETLDADILGVSVLELCPDFEPAVKYLNKHGEMGSLGLLPTTSKVPKSVLSAGAGTTGYAYSATPSTTTTPPTSVTVTTPVPTAPSQLGSPPGDGSAWQPAPAALLSAIQKANSASGAEAFAPGSTYWISQDPNSPEWYFVSVYSPEPPNSAAPDQFAGIEELVNGTWDIASSVGEQAPGCYGPGHDQPNGPSAVPADILSDFAQTC